MLHLAYFVERGYIVVQPQFSETILWLLHYHYIGIWPVPKELN